MVATAVAPADFKTYQDRKMKDEKTSDGFTQFPNAVIDNFLKEIDLVSELKVTIVIIRKTVGYQKKTDIISTSQFEEISGLAHQSVIDGLRLALERGIVYREKIGQYWSYGLKLVQPLDTFENETSPAARQEVVQPVDRFSQKVVQPLDTQKKDLNKTLNKDSTPKGVGEIALPRQVESKIQIEIKPDKKKPKGEKRARDQDEDQGLNPDLLSSHPAVQVWRETHKGRYPNQFQIPTIIEQIGQEPKKLQDWRECLVYYAQQPRWDQTNLTNIMDCFQKGKYKRNGEQQQQQQRGPYLGGNAGQQQLVERPAFSRPVRPIKPVGSGPGGRLSEAELSEGYQS